MRFVSQAIAGLTFSAVAIVAAPAAHAQTGEAPTIPANCITITLWNGKAQCLNAIPESDGPTGSIGYGSLGTGSVLSLISQLVLVGSNTLSVQVPVATGSYAPGSTGSYGPEASIGRLSSETAGSLISGSVTGS